MFFEGSVAFRVVFIETRVYVFLRFRFSFGKFKVGVGGRRGG